ncbi:monovalent cation/H+ antiporter complex subunit F [Bdellovibrio bacteriovorus]|uniref:monovalent cation/H+ antiporter complex subunit F n=1 Tax=Bdellovibrio bacteriovorus TaxID=959 RepID=UPI00045C0DBE|nr:monovalent cation/H+ antiporter complex subunit F [Bdellovibrio bacteriovorus]AHZ84816.1 hypothetical protein EP01_07680 [Bdellovibrio bacteriovorus]BEV68702.1 hypothetical protein Bb109J_c2122 [Bdellovibrio bacteriovorus]
MIYIMISALIMSAGLAMYRCIKGPDWMDRVMTFDLLNNIAIASAVLFAVFSNSEDAVSLILVLAPLSFLSNTFFVFLLERKKDLL